MDPLTISALISIAPSIAGMNWNEIFNGDKYSNEGWHGWDSAKKNQYMVQSIDAAFKLSMKSEGSTYTPQQLFWQMILPFVFRSHEKTWQGFYGANKASIDLYVAEAEKTHGFSFYELAPKAQVLKSKIGGLLQNKTVIYGAIGLVLLWIVSIVVKIAKK